MILADASDMPDTLETPDASGAPLQTVAPLTAAATATAPWSPDSTEPIRPEDLFQPDALDRSPAVWRERLRAAARQTPAAPATPPPTVTPPRAQSRPAFPPPPITNRPAALPVNGTASERAPFAPSPLPETTRRFLQPLVGVDPAVAPVYRDARAAEVAAAHHADALTDGNVTILSAGQSDERPETLGLLAHELTHIARRRDPRFIPPIARAADRNDQPPTGIATETSATALLADDESLARRVEARVVRAARAYQASQGAEFDAPGSDRDRAPRSQAGEPTRDTGRWNSEDWNGLPAPWEPLPDWMTEPAFEPIAGTTRAMPVAAAPMASVAPVAPIAPVAPMTQLAEEGHESEGASAAPASAAPAPHDPSTPAEPDLDALARQVYGILKRRLALEHRSAG